MKSIVLPLLAMTVLMTSACNSSEQPAQTTSATASTSGTTPPGATTIKEIGKKEAAGYVITLSSETGSLKQGANNLTLEFRKGDQLTDPGNVEVKPMMEMKGLGPMLANTKATPSGTAGRYNVTTDLSMAGPWKIMVAFSGREAEFDLVTQ